MLNVAFLGRLDAQLALAACFTGALLYSAPAQAKPIKDWRANLDRIKGCKVLPNQGYANSLHAETLFDPKAGLNMMVPVKEQQRLTYQCGGQKVGVFLYDVGPEAAQSALAFVSARLWGGQGPTAEHPDRAYRNEGTVVVLSSSSRTPLDELFAPAGAAGPGVDSPLSSYEELSQKGNLLLYKLKRYDEALAHYREYQKRVDADPSAPPMARWDAAMGGGFSAAFSGKMDQARAGFQAALQPAQSLGPRKLAETQFNLACSQAELGQADAAIETLSRCMATAHKAGAEMVAHYQQSMRTDSSLRSLQNDPRLHKIIAP